MTGIATRSSSPLIDREAGQKRDEPLTPGEAMEHVSISHDDPSCRTPRQKTGSGEPSRLRKGWDQDPRFAFPSSNRGINRIGHRRFRKLSNRWAY